MDINRSAPLPHYLLTVETGRENNPVGWRFTIKKDNGDSLFQAADVEPGVYGERLDLLTIIRALEALDQPSKVTLTSSSAYIRQGIQYGILEWRANDWRWEFFGHMVPIKNADLWQRMDHLLMVHNVHCRQLRFDGPHNTLVGPSAKPQSTLARCAPRAAAEIWIRLAARMKPAILLRHVAAGLQNIRRRYSHLGQTTKPCPGSG